MTLWRMEYGVMVCDVALCIWSQWATAWLCLSLIAFIVTVIVKPDAAADTVTAVGTAVTAAFHCNQRHAHGNQTNSTQLN